MIENNNKNNSFDVNLIKNNFKIVETTATSSFSKNKFKKKKRQIRESTKIKFFYTFLNNLLI